MQASRMSFRVNFLSLFLLIIFSHIQLVQITHVHHNNCKAQQEHSHTVGQHAHKAAEDVPKNAQSTHCDVCQFFTQHFQHLISADNQVYAFRAEAPLSFYKFTEGTLNTYLGFCAKKTNKGPPFVYSFV